MHNNTMKPHNFGEIAALQELFEDARRRRQGRNPPQVMVVEDDHLTRRIVSGALKDSYAMISACDAREAVADYLMYAPDVVFLDIGLPDVDGFAVLDQIMLLDPEAFVVMFSSSDYAANVDRAYKAGAKGFIGKPFHKEELHNFIRGSAMHHHKSCVE